MTDDMSTERDGIIYPRKTPSPGAVITWYDDEGKTTGHCEVDLSSRYTTPSVYFHAYRHKAPGEGGHMIGSKTVPAVMWHSFRLIVVDFVRDTVCRAIDEMKTEDPDGK